MHLTIDNLDGLGALDYTPAVDRSGTTAGLTIERNLNAPSIVRGQLCLEGTTLARPIRQARVAITSDSGNTLFTGYLATEPVAIYAGVASEGPVYRLVFAAVSDEWLLDKQAPGARVGPALSTAGATVVSRLANRLDAGRLSTAGLSAGRAVGVFHPATAAPWSAHAGTVANTTYAAYRALNGALNLAPVGNTVHALSDGDGTLSVAALHTAAVRELANDVTLSGDMEPTTYWTELFSGDGTTVEFDLSGDPDAPSAGHATLIDDHFAGASFDTQTWQLADSGSHLAVGGQGLLLSGGNGLDGQTALTAWDPVELGGTLVLELANVSLASTSAGILGGLYAGPTLQANCFAGFHIGQSGGETILQPLINGSVTGTAFTLLSGHLYTLRLHLHCAEMQRVRQTYYATVAGVVQQFGNGLIPAAMALVFEVRDLGNSSNTPVTILYDGAVASTPAQASLSPVNALQLFGSVGAVTLTRTGSAWITSTDPTSGTGSTRLAGKPNDGLDCTLTSGATGKITFLPGRVPIANEIVTVQYRGRARAIARLADAASIALETAGGGVGTARWLGKVVRPAARSSDDCESAAQAILSFSTDRAAALTGSYVTVNPAAPDIWPGDILALTANGSTLTVLVRRVAIEDHGAAPEALTYRLAFANDWAEGLGITLSEAIATDALLPLTALNLAVGTSAPVLANLPQLSVTGLTGSGSSAAITVDAGTAPPTGGGFEVRRHDGAFGSGASATASGDLVLRSPVRGFSIPRAAFAETFFIRMYDASTPPLYSRQSSAITTHLPLG